MNFLYDSGESLAELVKRELIYRQVKNLTNADIEFAISEIIKSPHLGTIYRLPSLVIEERKRKSFLVYGRNLLTGEEYGPISYKLLAKKLDVNENSIRSAINRRTTLNYIYTFSKDKSSLKTKKEAFEFILVDNELGTQTLYPTVSQIAKDLNIQVNTCYTSIYNERTLNKKYRIKKNPDFKK